MLNDYTAVCESGVRSLKCIRDNDGFVWKILDSDGRVIYARFTLIKVVIIIIYIL